MSEQPQGSSSPQMRPLGVGEIIDASIKLVRRHFRALATVTLVVTVPIGVIGGLVTLATTDFCQGPACTNELAADRIYVWENDVAYFGGRAVNILLGLLQFVIVQIACFRILAEGYLGRAVGAQDSMRYALSRGGATLWLTLLLFLGLVVAFLALFLPGIWLAVAWSVAFPVLLVERTGGVQALKRSFQLVKGFWWATLARLLVAGRLVFVAAAVVGGGLVALLLFAVDQASLAGLVLQSLVGVLIGLVTTPFLAAVVILVYFDLRVRTEGFDLAVLAERMGGDDATQSHAPSGREGADAFGRPMASEGAAPAADGWAPPIAPREPSDPGAGAAPKPGGPPQP
jgi:hypothetical protein